MASANGQTARDRRIPGEQRVDQVEGAEARERRLVAHPRDCLRVELREIADVLGEPPAQRDRARSALLERSVVEEGVGLSVQDLVAERRGLGRVAQVDPHAALLHPRQQGLQSVGVGGVGHVENGKEPASVARQ